VEGKEQGRSNYEAALPHCGGRRSEKEIFRKSRLDRQTPKGQGEGVRTISIVGMRDEDTVFGRVVRGEGSADNIGM